MNRYVDKYSLLLDSSNAFEKAMKGLNIAVMTDPRIVDDSGRSKFVITKLTNNKHVVIVRDSILYRADSIVHHTALLIREYNRKLTNLNRMKFNERFDHKIKDDFARGLQLTSTYYSEDVIVNIISLFDYVANFFGYWKYGVEKLKIKWKGLMSCARDVEYEKQKTRTSLLADSGMGTILLTHHSEYWSKLEDYRGDIVHNHMLGPSSRISTDYMKGQVDVRIYAPKNKLKSLEQLGGVIKDDKMDYIEAIILIANNGILRLIDIVDHMHDLHDYNAPLPLPKIVL